VVTKFVLEGADRIQERLARLNAAVQDFRPVWPLVEEVLVEAVKNNFETRGGYAGVVWPPLTERYRRWKLARFGDKAMMHLTERLFESLTQPWHSDHVSDSGPTFMEFGTRVRYAKAHHFGRPAINLPRRTVIPKVTRREGSAIADIILA